MNVCIIRGWEEEGEEDEREEREEREGEKEDGGDMGRGERKDIREQKGEAEKKGAIGRNTNGRETNSNTFFLSLFYLRKVHTGQWRGFIASDSVFHSGPIRHVPAPGRTAKNLLIIRVLIV